jgi:hypothetical protein
MSFVYDSLEGRARFIDLAVLYVDSHEVWKVGDFGQTVSSYQTITYQGVPLSDAIGIVALAVEKSSSGYTLYGVSSDGSRTFYEAALDSTGKLTEAITLSDLDLLRVEAQLGADLNGNGGIGAGDVLYTDTADLDIVLDGYGQLHITTPYGNAVPLFIGGQALSAEMLGDTLDVSHVVATTNGYQLYVVDETGNTFKAGFSLEGRSASVERLTPEQVREEESLQRADLNNRADTPLTAGWTEQIKTSALRQLVEQHTSNGNKMGYAQMLQLVVTAVNSIEPGQAVGADLVGDLRAIAARGHSLFGNDADNSDYLSYVFSNMVGSTRANNFYTGGATKATPLGNLTSSSTSEHLQKLAFKWLLGLDMPNPTTEGDTANPDARAATGVYKAFEASLFGADGPLYTDVNQGSAGTCYLMASAAAIAYSNPDAIKAIFITNESLVPGYQTYGVRLYDAMGEARWVTVNNQLAVVDETASTPLYSKLSNALTPQVTKLWLPLLEKAYAQMNEQGFIAREAASAGKNSMWAIEGGMSEVGSHILGKEAWAYADVDEPELANNNPFLMIKPVPQGKTEVNALADYVNSGNALWLASMLTTRDALDRLEFVEGHAFMALDADPSSADNTTVLVYNPWGSTPPGQPSYVAPFTADLAEIVGVEGLFFWMYDY